MKKYPDSYKQLDPKQKQEVDKLIDKAGNTFLEYYFFSKIRKVFSNLDHQGALPVNYKNQVLVLGKHTRKKHENKSK